MKHKKIIIIFIILIILLFILSNTVLGTLVDFFDQSITTTGDGAEDVKAKTGKTVGTIQVIGILISVAMLIVLGIKYMLGSAEEKAEYKKTMMPYLIGTVLIFGFSNITQVIYKYSTSIYNDDEELSTEVRAERGEVNVSELEDGQIRYIYQSTSIAARLINREMLDIYLQSIYDEAKKRNLLSEDGISLKPTMNN